MTSLDLTILSRLDELKQQCHELCDIEKELVTRGPKTGMTGEFFSSIQLWKERSLHQVLESLDKAGVASIDNHIEAMEHHEKAAKDLFELTRGCLIRTWDGINLVLDGFADDLADLVDNIVTSSLEEQGLIHEKVVKDLKDENQKLTRTCQDLENTKSSLEERLELLENTSDAGGDAILCNKLRLRIQHLVIRQRELSTELENAARERVKHRRELEKTRSQLAELRKSLALTRAMHDKETRQLAAMINLNHSQVAQILETSRNATDSKRHQESLERFDPLSGCTIVHLTPVSPPHKPPGSPPFTSHRRASSPILASPVRKKQEPPVKPRQLERPKSATTRTTRPSSARHQRLNSELHKPSKWCNG